MDRAVPPTESAEAAPARAWPEAALVLAAHGSSQRDDGGASVLRHAEELRRRALFAEVRVGFLRQQPGLDAALEGLAAPTVFVVPVFAAKGYLARTAIARAMGLTGGTAAAPAGVTQRICFCDPVGVHPAIPDIMASRVRRIQERNGLAPAHTAVVVVGHGTARNAESARQTQVVADALAGERIAAEVRDMMLEVPPRVEDWRRETTAEAVIVLPFLIAGDYHGAKDLPARIGLDPTDSAIRALNAHAGAAGPFHVADRRVWYCGPVGNEPAIADVIVDTVEAFDAG